MIGISADEPSHALESTIRDLLTGLADLLIALRRDSTRRRSWSTTVSWAVDTESQRPLRGRRWRSPPEAKPCLSITHIRQRRWLASLPAPRGRVRLDVDGALLAYRGAGGALLIKGKAKGKRQSQARSSKLEMEAESNDLNYFPGSRADGDGSEYLLDTGTPRCSLMPGSSRG